MAEGHGGARPGAGRKATAEQFESEIAAAKKRCADTLPHRLETLIELAQGGYIKRTRKMEPAALVLVEEVQRDTNGSLIYDELERPLKIKVRAFPEAAPGEMVCIEEIQETLAPDRAANIYLADRILGRPTQAVEVSGPDGGEIPLSSRPDPARLSLGDLEALEALLAKATPSDGNTEEEPLTSNGNTDTGRGAG